MTTSPHSPQPVRLAGLTQWLLSWVQRTGAIHGFHNHSVWGDNPYRYGDFTAGHSTFASPLMLALVAALRQRPDPRGVELITRLARFQVDAVQANGEFKHIGFQIGEICLAGLVHNVVPCMSLCRTVRLMPEAFGEELRSGVDRTVRRVLDACDKRYGAEVGNHSTANQEYIRNWARIEHMLTFEHNDWNDAVQRDLMRLIDRYHVRGVPDDECDGSLRTTGNRDQLEPAEYYGLMIHPLLLAFQRFADARFLDAARRLTKHIIRSSWRDDLGRVRVHRAFHRIRGTWEHIREPMLIGGIGVTLDSIRALASIEPDPAIDAFLADYDRTYAGYQSPAGFFLAASGWDREPDLIPSTAWQSHDLMYLLNRHPIDERFWDRALTPSVAVAIVLGPSMCWIEADPHWTVRGYQTMQGMEVAGRKDRVRFGIDIAKWIDPKLVLDPELLMPDRPAFLRLDDRIVHVGGREDLLLLNASGKPYDGPALAVAGDRSPSRS